MYHNSMETTAQVTVLNYRQSSNNFTVVVTKIFITVTNFITVVIANTLNSN